MEIVSIKKKEFNLTEAEMELIKDFNELMGEIWNEIDNDNPTEYEINTPNGEIYRYLDGIFNYLEDILSLI